MNEVWEILKEYLGEAIIFIAMILRTARSGTTVEEKEKKRRKKRIAKAAKNLEKAQKVINDLDGEQNGIDNGQ